MPPVVGKRCGHRECNTRPLYGKAGTTKPELCAEHARSGTVNASNKKCRRSGCNKQPLYGKAGNNKLELRREHARDGILSVRAGKRCVQRAKETTADLSNSRSRFEGQIISGRGLNRHDSGGHRLPRWLEGNAEGGRSPMHSGRSFL